MKILLILTLSLMLLFLLAMWFTLPSLRGHPALIVLKTYRYIAHRGLHDEKKGIPENSMTAFRLAVEKGYPIETDLHLTADGEIVLFHDQTLERMCGVGKKPEEMTLTELKALSLAGTAEKIPTLGEFLALVDKKVPVLLEFKAEGFSVGKLCRAADKLLSRYRGVYFIQSFQPAVPAWYRFHRPSVCRGQLSAAFRDRNFGMRFLGDLGFNVFCRPDFISYEQETSSHPMRRLSAFYGAYQVGWTFPKQEEIDAKAKIFDTFIFEGFEPEKR